MGTTEVNDLQLPLLQRWPNFFLFSGVHRDHIYLLLRRPYNRFAVSLSRTGLFQGPEGLLKIGLT